MVRVDAGVRRYESLDAWRGVACLFVVVGHCTIYTTAYAEPADPFQYLGNQALALFRWMVVGVPMFFVISGYCVTAAAYTAQARSHRFSTFMYRRARRIYPPYYFLLLVTGVAVCAAWLAGFPRLFSDDRFPIPHPL